MNTTSEKKETTKPPKRKRTSPYMVLAQVFQRWTPGATVFAVLLTFIVMVAALLFTDAGPRETVDAWGEGLSGLLAFMGQIALALFFGNMLTHTRPVQRVLRKVFDLPKTAPQAYAMVFLTSVALTIFQWAVGLVAGAILAKGIAGSMARRGIKVDFPLLVASAYSAFVVAGLVYNGTIPLTSASRGSFVEEQLGHTIPLSETVMTPWNLAALAGFIILTTFALHFVRPRTDEEIQEISYSEELERDVSTVIPRSSETPVDWIETRSITTKFIGILLIAFLISHFARNGFDLSLNIVNWAMLAGIMLFVGSPRELGVLVKNATSSVGDVLLQFPLYAGILGVATGTGLINVLSDAFISISNTETLPLFAFVSAMIVNLAVPSAGGQFIIQGPIMLQAGAELGVDPALTVMTISYGDTLTNMIQPFFALPVLAIAGISVREVFKYTFVTFLVGLVVFSAALAGWSYLG
ncbi:short-chain fatty acid transporter [Trueperella bialowiezensis]|uniref:Short-chain fatty acids transporter n=1 Tax=Trueperella bialowiezensis TaxID=312285 RepID=A0A448PDK6_9ACTO|nr:TIGR00366 family protein [Trueperella bialowiezensis]VEI13023.1 Short-chain fatty acids transporter [Trueperella bialowiezensis]